jgi:phosphopantetheinyl transferase
MKIHVAPIETKAREAVRSLIDAHVGAEVELTHDAHGAPLLVGSPLHISISHSRRFAAIALDADRRIGIDVEEARQEQLARVSSRFVRQDDCPLPLLTLWTIKEAVYKAAGIPGLSLLDIRAVSPTLADLPAHARSFAIQTTATPHYTLTTAQPLSNPK